MKSSRFLLIVCFLVFQLQMAFALDHTTIKVHPDRWFSTGWTHAIHTPNGIFWYNSYTGAGVLGKLDSTGNHTSIKTNSFSKGWTHIINTPKGILWYNSLSGAGAVGQFDSSGNYTNIESFKFSSGWTNVISTPEGLIWYNAKTGAAVVGRLE